MTKPDQNRCVCGEDLTFAGTDLCDRCAWDLGSDLDDPEDGAA